MFLLGECDLEAEAAVQQRYGRMFAGDPDVLVPKVYPELTKSEVLTTEYVEGLRYYEFAATAPEAVKNKAGAVIWRVATEAIFKHRIYNADPHPGNYIFVGDKVCFIDFGFAKEFSPAFIDAWRDHTIALMDGNLEDSVGATKRMGLQIEDPELWKQLFEAMRGVDAAWVDDEVYEFTRAAVLTQMQSSRKLFRLLRGARLPKEYVAITRVLWGHHALLGDLKSRAHWKRILERVVRKAPEESLAQSL